MPPFPDQVPRRAEPAGNGNRCDGCGRCCLHKFEDEDTGELFHTRVACRLDTQLPLHAICEPPALVLDCVRLTPADAALRWLPETCAYRRFAEAGRCLEWASAA